MIAIQKPGDARVCRYSDAAVYERGGGGGGGVIHVCHPK